MPFAAYMLRNMLRARSRMLSSTRLMRLADCLSSVAPKVWIRGEAGCSSPFGTITVEFWRSDKRASEAKSRANAICCS